ncbi:MAG: BamA/TamA family outer membrane protein [Flammeovirgaceae bacterium]|nr:BamA/TamA family outer membrane protein [Flammeovirgaceae bacterium]
MRSYVGKPIKLFTLLFLAWLVSGCLGTRYLQENQKLLYRQTLEAPKGFSKEGLSDLYVKKVNRKLFGLPINSLVWMHQEGKKRYTQQKFIDKKVKVEEKFDRKIAATKNQKKSTSLQYRKQEKIATLDGKIENGNLFMQWGEPVAVFDSASLDATQEKMSDYLFNRGYFHNSISYRTKEFKKRIGVVYEIKPGRPSLYDTIFFQIEDRKIDSIVQSTQSASLIKLNDRYDQDKLNKERERLDLQMKDLGYFDFTRQYIEFSVDTAYGGGYQIALQVGIKNPPRRDSHKIFHIDSISFTTDAAVNSTDTLKRQSVEKYNITFNYFKSEYSKKLLAQRVFIKQDSLYSRTNSFDTQRQLANLDIFKFINMNYDSSDGKFIANVFCSPLNKYSWSNEAGLTMTQGYPGPYISTNLKKRNVFGGMEILEFGGRFGFEGVASATDPNNVYASTEASVNGSITFPQFLLPLTEKAQFRFAQYNPRTRLLAGFTYTDRPEYTRSISTVSDTYTWQNKKRAQYSFTLINLNVIQSTLTSAFDSLLTDLQVNDGNNLKNSFNPSFVSSMILGITWNPVNYGNTERSSHLLRMQVESGGTLFNFAEPGYIVDRGLELYQYVRLSLDGRRNQVIDKNTMLSYRFNGGVGYAYSENEVLPYEKYFFAGGSNSIRAWLPRRLGLGSVPPNLSEDPTKDGLFDYSFEKPGDILLEGSVELRKKLFGFVNGAIFLDVGNVWSFTEIQTSEAGDNKASWKGNSKLSKTFYRDLAVGTGFGLRFDFSFLLLRLDVGMKVVDPGRESGDRFVLDKVRFFKPFGTEKEPVILMWV